MYTTAQYIAVPCSQKFQDMNQLKLSTLTIQ